MTLITSFAVDGYPIMLGDILISGLEGDKQQQVNIPTIENFDDVFPKGSGFIPIGMHQKIHIINKFLAIAWADSKLAAKITIQEMAKTFSDNKKPTREELEQFFNDIDPWCQKNLSIVGIASDSAGLFTFGYECHGFSTNSFGEVRFAGSGGNDLHELLLLLDNTKFNLTADNKINSLEKALAYTFSITSHLTGLEMCTGETLRSYYGGGYEILSFISGEFSKVAEATYLVWLCKYYDDTSVTIEIPTLIIKHSYIENFLLIRRIILDVDNKPNIHVKILNDSCYIVEPLTESIRDRGLKDIKIPDIQSSFTCNYILVQKPGEETEVLNLVSYTPSGEYPIQINIDNGTENVVINKKFLRTVSEKIRSKYLGQVKPPPV